MINGGAVTHSARLLQVYRVASALGSARDQESLFAVVLDAALRVVHAERAFILQQKSYSLDLSAESLRIASAQPSGEIDSELPIARLGLSISVMDRAVETREVQCSSNLQDDKRFWGQSIVAHGLRSVLCAPLFSTNGLLGFLYLDNRGIQNAFTTDDQDLVRALAAQAALALEKLVLYEDLRQQFDQTIFALVQAIDHRDHYTAGHSQRVADYVYKFARKLDLTVDLSSRLWYGSMLHDIGKIGVPEAILKKQGPLTPEERLSIEKHPLIGYDILRRIQLFNPILPIVRSHHERWDGTGYPDRLAGLEIPFEGRITALADVWDAMTSARPYRAAFSKEVVAEDFRAKRGTHFDPDLVDPFLDTMLNGEEGL